MNFIKKSIDVNGKSYDFIDTQAELKEMALILPFRKKITSTEYLLCRENIPCWDKHPDICGIAVSGLEKDLETLLVKKLGEESGYILEANEIHYLGLCAADRRTNTIYHLYTADLSHHKVKDEFFDEHSTQLFWASTERIMESLDSQLIAAYAKLYYLFLK